ncbi:MAG: c-type cytochrome [Gemmatimonadota bacterium]
MRSSTAIVALALAGCGGDGSHAAVDRAAVLALETPTELRRGESLFDANCARCHGEAALGTEVGPPLVHPVYEPGHHADAAFVLAVERGVRPHHWRFGPMPPVPGVSREEVAEITAYVRWLQREAGIE